MSQTSWTVFRTSIGYCALAWNRRGLQSLVLPCEERQSAEQEMIAKYDALPSTPGSHGFVFETIVRIKHYFAGKETDFGQLPVDLGRLTCFQQATYSCLRQVPAGRRITYSQLAAQTGSPLAARAVGRAMATNPLPLIIPCHRVVAASGKLGGFSAPRGVWMKRWMLDLEARHSQAN